MTTVGVYTVGRYFAHTAQAVGLSAVANKFGSDALHKKCNAKMDQYINHYRSQGNLEYQKYLDGFCYGDALRCRDPLLDIHCGLNINSCLSPYECHSFGNCLPAVSQIGISPRSVYDLAFSLTKIEMAWHNGFWDSIKYVPPHSEP